MGKIFYIMGKSASGKDTIYQALIENKRLPLKRIIPYTTRPMRQGEESGKEYYFCTEEQAIEYEKQNKVIELRAYHTVHGVWKYFTADDGQVDLSQFHYLAIGTLEAYNGMRKFYGEENLCPIYIEVDDKERLLRAIERESHQEQPKYEEMCRRFLADAKDFSKENCQAAGITRTFENIRIENTIEEILAYIQQNL